MSARPRPGIAVTRERCCPTCGRYPSGRALAADDMPAFERDARELSALEMARKWDIAPNTAARYMKKLGILPRHKHRKYWPDYARAAS